jgi:type IV pilus assembly protein PilV
MISKQKGVALLEVLIALVVVAVGLLGMALLQVNSMQHVHQGQMHSHSTYLLYDISDRIRANTDGASSGDYDLAFGASVTAAKNCESVNCTEAEMADFDLEQWEDHIQRVLPGGDGFVSVSGGIATIQIRYDDNRDESDTAAVYELKAPL